MQVWREFDDRRWRFADGELVGDTTVYDGAITDPAASIFLVSQEVFAGDVVVSMDITFEVGRYVGVYLDFDQHSQSGIWMATGHALSNEEKARHVESGYIKTVENGHWVVRTSGELVVENGRTVGLQFARKADDYSLWRNGRLVATYHKAGGYPAGPLQLRLTNARARISRLQVLTD